MIRDAAGAADRAITYLINCLEDSEIHERVYARRHRIKSEEGVEDKIIRKRREKKPDYSWASITDIVGIRLITLYRDDIEAVTECVLRALIGEAEVMPRLFERRNLAEFRFHIANARPITDPLAIKLEALAKRWKQPTDAWTYETVEDDRYSSIHFVTKVAPAKKAQNLVPVEIQIRSVFEDAWGEIDHLLLFEKRRLGNPPDPTDAQMERHSRTLKRLLDAAAEFADTMRYLRLRETPPPELMKPTLDGAHYVAEFLKRIGAPVKVQTRIMQVIKEKEVLDAALKNGGDANRASYVRLADDFAELLADQQGPTGFLHGHEESAAIQLVYVLRMEEAVCRLLSYSDKQVPLAIQRLREVVEEFPNRPVAWLRLGEAYARLVESAEPGSALDEATEAGISAYEQAAKETSRLAELEQGSDARLFAASMVQEQYLRDHLGRLHAFLLWRAAAARRRADGASDPAALDAAQRAASLTYGTIKRAPGDEQQEPMARKRALNSLIYYVAESVDFAKKLNADNELPCSREDLIGFITELEKDAPTDDDHVRALQVWDTIGYARWMLEGREAGRPAAERVLRAYSAQQRARPPALSRYVRDQEGLAVARAIEILGLAPD